jgi:diguanylate cyclase (GGDEF)-like protein
MSGLAFDITTLRRLPTLPAVAVRLLNCFSDPNVPIGNVVEIVQFDPAVTAKLLRAASSASLGGSTKGVTDLRRAVHMLGIKKVTSLALCFSLCEGSMNPGPFAKLYRKVWLRAVVQAQAAADIAALVAPPRQSEFFSAGLLSEIGPLAILKSSPQEFPELLRAESAEPTDYTTGTELSAAILAHWQMPAEFCDAVRNKWRSLDELRDLPAETDLALSHATALAAATAEYFCEQQKGFALVRVHELAETLYGMKQDAVREFIERVQAHLMENCELLETDVSTWGQPSEILAVAMEQLSHLAVANLESQSDVGQTRLVNQENRRLRRRVEDLLHRSITDVLTGLFNRAHFDEQLPQWIRNARAARKTVGLLFLDVDHFKKVNDTHGHAVGDAVLRQISAVVSETVRDGDLVARYGGEELVVVAFNPTINSLAILGERIRSAIEKQVIVAASGEVRPTVSVGGSIIDPVNSTDAAGELVHSADQAMYVAKRNGRNRVEVWSVLPHPSEDSAVAGEMGWPIAAD